MLVCPTVLLALYEHYSRARCFLGKAGGGINAIPLIRLRTMDRVDGLNSPDNDRQGDC
jgi:hypothetical protein